MSEAFEQKVQRFSDYAKRTTGREIHIVTERDMDTRFANTYEQIHFQIADSLPDNLNLSALPAHIQFEPLIASLTTFYNNPVAIAYRLIADGYYEVDFSELITLNTELTLCPKLDGAELC